MRYNNITEAVFISRPNRFIAEVDINGKKETVHVKNTGRCKELLVSGSRVWLTAPGTPGRKTVYDLIAVKKNKGGIFNIDSQAPNKVVLEWLKSKNFEKVVPEYRYGDSRLDFYLENKDKRILMEVKGCTLEINCVGYFPDAPTLRGIKHLNELKKAVKCGYFAYLAYVIQMDNVNEVRPNINTHPEYGTALGEAEKAGVKVLFLRCHVTPDEVLITNCHVKGD